MTQRIALLAAVAFVAGCGEAPFEPTSDLAPSFVLTSVGITNPSFESGLTGWSAGDVYPGWGTTAHVDVVCGWQSSDGSCSVDMNGFHPGYITQDIATVPGTAYTVQFDLAGNPGSPQNVKTLQVSAAGSSALYQFDTSGKSAYNMGWTPQTFTFTATAAVTTLRFESLHGAPYTPHPDRAQGPAIDNVRVNYDGQIDPVTVDDCKKGGWAQYGFRNQGLCIQYVNTGKDSR